jgi:hypothetical protein
MSNGFLPPYPSVLAQPDSLSISLSWSSLEKEEKSSSSSFLRGSSWEDVLTRIELLYE